VERGEARQILDAWERGVDQAPARRALTVLEELAPTAAGPAPDELSAGERDGALLATHVELFGPTLDAVGECPHCDEPVELAFDAGALWRHAIAARGDGDTPAPIPIEVDGFRLRVRRLTAGDLVAAEDASDPGAARAVMLERCVLDAARGPAPVATAELSEVAVGAVAEALAAADPGAGLTLGMSCPACDHRWEETLDVGAFVWREVEARAVGLLHQVDTLARAYGWTESDVLRLSPRRRVVYAELAEA
jgi:hypothetical protein